MASIAPSRTTVLPTDSALCPFHDGPETLDTLLAELSAEDYELVDACLDLRSMIGKRASAEACLDQACHIRQLLDGRHHLAFYRVRTWLRRAIRVEVRSHRGESWTPHPLPLDFARLDEVVNGVTAPLIGSGAMPELAQLRFAFAG